MERGAVSREKLRILVLDKADRMLDMGFKLPVDRIVAKMPRIARRSLLGHPGGAAGRLAAASRNPLRHVHKPKVEEAAEVQHRFVHLRAPLFPR
jgi:hypothetical protein